MDEHTVEPDTPEEEEAESEPGPAILFRHLSIAMLGLTMGVALARGNYEFALLAIAAIFFVYYVVAADRLRAPKA